MPSEDAHFQQAEHNLQYFRTFDLLNTPYRDWATTALFYAAVHYIRAIAARHRRTNIASHGEIDKLFSVLPVFRQNSDVRNDYRQLKDDSRAARYDIIALRGADIQDLHDGELARVRAFARSHLGR